MRALRCAARFALGLLLGAAYGFVFALVCLFLGSRFAVRRLCGLR